MSRKKRPATAPSSPPSRAHSWKKKLADLQKKPEKKPVPEHLLNIYSPFHVFAVGFALSMLMILGWLTKTWPQHGLGLFNITAKARIEPFLLVFAAPFYFLWLYVAQKITIQRQLLWVGFSGFALMGLLAAFLPVLTALPLSLFIPLLQKAFPLPEFREGFITSLEILAVMLGGVGWWLTTLVVLWISHQQWQQKWRLYMKIAVSSLPFFIAVDWYGRREIAFSGWRLALLLLSLLPWVYMHKTIFNTTTPKTEKIILRRQLGRGLAAVYLLLALLQFAGQGWVIPSLFWPFL
ncbi:MAG: hypothetical protein ACOYK8_05100 [Alphaproteobacteria bacterium]